MGGNTNKIHIEIMKNYAILPDLHIIKTNLYIHFCALQISWENCEERAKRA